MELIKRKGGVLLKFILSVTPACLQVRLVFWRKPFIVQYSISSSLNLTVRAVIEKFQSLGTF